MKKLINKILLKLGYVPIMGTLIVERKKYYIQLLKGIRYIPYQQLIRASNPDWILNYEIEQITLELLEKVRLFVELKVTDNLDYDRKEINIQLYVANKRK
jgi:hypothetical protein